MKKLTFIAIAMFFILTSNRLFAQTSFTGTWKMTKQVSISGKLYVNGSPSQVTLTICGSDQKMDYLTSDGQNEEPSSETFTNGKAFETKTPMGRKKVVVLSWSDDKTSFTETSSIYSLTEAGKLDFKITDNWTISDGKLVLDRRNENYTNGETWESKADYEKQ